MKELQSFARALRAELGRRRDRARPRGGRAADLRHRERRPRVARRVRRRAGQPRRARHRRPRRRPRGDGPGSRHAARPAAQRARRRSARRSRRTCATAARPATARATLERPSNRLTSAWPSGAASCNERTARSWRACTALDVGTEFAKALVFEIGPDGRAIVRGVGRRRQGLAHMQSGTVADIIGRRRQLPGRPPGSGGDGRLSLQPGHRRHRRRASEGLHHERQPGAQEAGYADHGARARLADRGRRARGDPRGGADHHLGDRPAQRRCAPRPCRRDRCHDRRLLGHQPGQLPGPSRPASASSTPSRRSSIWAPCRPWPAMLDLDLVAIVAEPYAVARCMDDDQVQQAGALFIDVGGGTTDIALVRQGGIEGTRMFALGGRAFTKSLADRLELPFARAEEIKVDFAKGVTGRPPPGGRTDRQRGRRCVGGRRRAGARGVRQDGDAARPRLPVRWRRAAAADRRRPARPGVRSPLSRLRDRRRSSRSRSPRSAR